MRCRAGGERLWLPGLASGLQLAADDVGVGAVVMDQVPSRVGNVREETGDEVEGVEGLGLLVVVAVAGQIGGGLRAREEMPARGCNRRLVSPD